MACSREFAGVTANCPHDGNMLVALPQDQWEGKRLADRYKIEHRLGTGGMGVVYLAWHELMERWVAIKMLKSSFIEDEKSVKRFQQEAKAASRLKHPNVITVHDFGLAPTGQPYMVMDYLVSTHPDQRHKARSLAQEIKDCEQLPVERAIHVLSQACEALEHAHRQGVIHRDVKPANIMIVPNEDDPYFVKVVDFGVAKLLPINAQDTAAQGVTQVGEVCGSPVYMSPEQCMGQALDPRADIYSMGIVLYESLTGRIPLVGKNMVETMAKHMNEQAPSFSTVRPDLFIPDKVEQVVMTALNKHPHGRQQSMAELSQDLQFSIPRAGQAPMGKAADFLPLPEDEEESNRNWLIPTAVGAGVVAVLAAVGFFVLQPKPQPAPTKTPVQAVQPAPVQPAPVQPTAVKPAPVQPAQPPVNTAPNTVPAQMPTTAAPVAASTPATAPVASTPKPHITAHKPPKKVKLKGQEDELWKSLRQLKSNYHDGD